MITDFQNWWDNFLCLEIPHFRYTPTKAHYHNATIHAFPFAPASSSSTPSIFAPFFSFFPSLNRLELLVSFPPIPLRRRERLGVFSPLEGPPKTELWRDDWETVRFLVDEVMDGFRPRPRVACWLFGGEEGAIVAGIWVRGETFVVGETEVPKTDPEVDDERPVRLDMTDEDRLVEAFGDRPGEEPDGVGKPRTPSAPGPSSEDGTLTPSPAKFVVPPDAAEGTELTACGGPDGWLGGARPGEGAVGAELVKREARFSVLGSIELFFRWYHLDSFSFSLPKLGDGNACRGPEELRLGCRTGVAPMLDWRAGDETKGGGGAAVRWPLRSTGRAASPRPAGVESREVAVDKLDRSVVVTGEGGRRALGTTGASGWEGMSTLSGVLTDGDGTGASMSSVISIRFSGADVTTAGLLTVGAKTGAVGGFIKPIVFRLRSTLW